MSALTGLYRVPESMSPSLVGRGLSPWLRSRRSILDELRALWETKLLQSGALNAPPPRCRKQFATLQRGRNSALPSLCSGKCRHTRGSAASQITSRSSIWIANIGLNRSRRAMSITANDNMLCSQQACSSGLHQATLVCSSAGRSGWRPARCRTGPHRFTCRRHQGHMQASHLARWRHTDVRVPLRQLGAFCGICAAAA